MTKINCVISDQLDELSSLKEFVHFKSLSDVASLYETKLLALNQIIEKLSQAQRKWLHLEPIYGNETMVMKKELFSSIDNVFRSIMSRNNNSKIKLLVDRELNPNLYETLDELLVNLEECQQCLFAFLEEKRFSFPRLYFLGDDSLLEILAYSKQPEKLQTHIKHLFQAIHSVVFNSMNQIISFKSVHNEEVTLRQVCRKFILLYDFMNILS